MSLSVFRRIVEKGMSLGKLGGGGRMMSSSIMRCDVWRPLLMVPRLFDDSGNAVSKFHDEDQVSYANKISDGIGTGIDDSKGKGGVEVEVEVVGMSHGWVSLYNQINQGMHMMNPINGHRIELPSLPVPHHPHSHSHSGGVVSRLVLSHSPDQDQTSICRAVMIYNGGSKLAYCVPGSSEEWTPIVFADHVDYDVDEEIEYQDVLYEDRDDDSCVFHCLRSNPLGLELELETWDVMDPLSPILLANTCGASNSPRPCRSRQDWDLKNKCWRINYLVHKRSNWGSYLYLVVRHVLPNQNQNQPSTTTSRPYKTIDFDVYRINIGPEKEYEVYEDYFEFDFRYMKDSLDDEAIFIGTNCSTSVIANASECPAVRPNCIYYTDDIRLMHKATSLQCQSGGGVGGGGLDNGIFDYQNNTFSACSCGSRNCPLDYPQMLDPAPIWFHFSLPPV